MHHEGSLAGPSAPVAAAATLARTGGPDALAEALVASRRDTLATFQAYRQARPDLVVPYREELNPPLWELGHVGWFQEFWIGRFAARGEGRRSDPDSARSAPRRANADALYHSSHVPHASRWTLPLPDADATRADLAAQLDETLALLRTAGDTDDALYAWRLSLFHEDMHHEAALYMAQGLGIPVADERWRCPVLPAPPSELAFDGGSWRLGARASDTGFHFDNELGVQPVTLSSFRIDAQACRWAEYLPAVEAGAVPMPRYLRREAGRWQQRRRVTWIELDVREPVHHVGLHEAEAWCRWAGRRLPTEAEWERAALTQPAAFRWGDVWEWTASPFTPFPGFEPHPYRDYSAPWFDGRPVLRGASYLTQPRMRHPRYRNFFKAHRGDVAAGFRSCAS